MPREVNRYRLNYMQAYVKQYDDGSEILQSYATDVVKKTSDGQYIRLWYGWSPATNKQVHAYCHRTFRDIPFADGTVEERKRVYKRKGYNLEGLKDELNLADCRREAKEFIKSLKAGVLYVWDNRYGYSTIYNKELREHYKGNKKMLELINILDACARRRLIRGKNPMNAFLKIYDFKFVDVWINSGLETKYNLKLY